MTELHAMRAHLNFFHWNTIFLLFFSSNFFYLGFFIHDFTAKIDTPSHSLHSLRQNSEKKMTSFENALDPKIADIQPFKRNELSKAHLNHSVFLTEFSETKDSKNARTFKIAIFFSSVFSGASIYTIIVYSFIRKT